MSFQEAWMKKEQYQFRFGIEYIVTNSKRGFKAITLTEFNAN